MSWPLFLSGCGLLLTGYVAGWLAGRDAERERQRREIEGKGAVTFYLGNAILDSHDVVTGSPVGPTPGKLVVSPGQWSAN